MRPHPSPSWAHRDFTARRLIRDAFAVRERLGDPRAVPGFRCSFLPDMPSSMTSGSSIVVSVQNTDVDIGLRHGPKNSALPIVPQSISRGARFSRLHWFATATACQVASPPCTDLTGLPANGGFYFQAFDGSVTLPVAGYNYNSVWTPLLAGLPPAGMAASLAALVRPCVARRFRRPGVSGLASMYPASAWSDCAPGHHGYQRACDLISGQASTGPLGPPVFGCAGKTDFSIVVSSSRRPRRVDYVIDS